MRRIRIAWAILGCIVLLALGSHIAVWRVTQNICGQLEELRASAESNNYPAALEQANALADYFASRQHLLEFFIKRETVAAASVSLHGLPAYVDEETRRDLFSEIDKAAEQVRMLEHLFFSVF